MRNKRRKKDKLNFIKIKNIYALKEKKKKNTIRKVRRQPTEQEKVIASHLPDKGLYTRKQHEKRQPNLQDGKVFAQMLLQR